VAARHRCGIHGCEELAQRVLGHVDGLEVQQPGCDKLQQLNNL
jgi:hypothetical protein